MRLRPRPLTVLLVVALGLRVAAWLAVVSADVPLLFDEAGYFDRALAIRQILLDGARFEASPAAAWERAYGDGHWPPVHPLALAAGMTIGGPTPAAARGVMVLLSALTTLLVYRLGCRAGGTGAGLAAGGLHAVYPTYVAYSHYLWSETTAVFLLLAALSAVSRLAASGRRWPLAWAAAAGGLLGLAALSRAALLPMLPAVAAWVLWRAGDRRHRPAAAATVLAAGLLVVLPWLVTLRTLEGRWLPMSTLGGYNLALGNHPDVPPGLGSSWGHEVSKARLRAALDAKARQGSTTWEAVASAAAREEIAERPGAAAVRVVERLWILSAPDFFPLRHLLGAVYPPVPPWLAGLAAVVAVAAYLLLTALAVCGLPGDRLAALCVLAGLLLPAVSIAHSRLHLPLLALTLPAAGSALVRLAAGHRPRPALVVAWSGLAVAALTSLPVVMEHYLMPSGHYAALGRISSRFGVEPVFSDRLRLRRPPGVRQPLEVEVVSAGVRFADGSRRRLWPAGARELEIDLLAPAGAEVPELAIRTPAGRPAPVRPLVRDAWRRWCPTAAGIEVWWSGASPPGVFRTPRTKAGGSRPRNRR